ncbi:hypothetical protein CLV56_2942 [Mumia flava]|uniref:Lactoylglutathione lyase n=1 Tax=Mumia flava TaxID=1348852 RepID=A0A0B2B4M3_9ACTN|nr:glyoxalase [Mumia flava]PJJ53453.1 hypothetical protein CLV56_2942 [Mumia flava]
MNHIDSLILEASDPSAAERFYAEAFDLGDLVQVRASDAATSGFRGFTISLIVSQPADADAYLDAAVAAGATTIKPASKSLWGYGGVVQAPDGTLWKVVTQSKKNKRPAERTYEALVLLLGVDDVAASKEFYVEQGLGIQKSFGKKYVELDTGDSTIELSLYGRKAAAKDAGVGVEGSGSHRIAIAGSLGALSDPDGFAWEAARASDTAEPTQT